MKGIRWVGCWLPSLNPVSFSSRRGVFRIFVSVSNPSEAPPTCMRPSKLGAGGGALGLAARPDGDKVDSSGARLNGFSPGLFVRLLVLGPAGSGSLLAGTNVPGPESSALGENSSQLGRDEG